MRLYSLLFFLLIICQGLQAEELDDLINGNFEDISKTLSVIDYCFQENRDDFLQRITLNKFQHTEKYKTFSAYAKQYLINLNYRNETCIKAFEIIDKKETLMIEFVKNNKTNMWYIDDAYLMMKDQKKELLMRGFSPLSYEQKFENLVSMQGTKDMETYCSLAKYGRINKAFLKENKLIITKDCKLIYTNVIVHTSNNEIIDLIYLTFKLFSVGHKDQKMYKSGWLLVDFGSMKDYYPPGNNLYIDFLLNRLEKNSIIQWDKPNDNFFIIDIHPEQKKRDDEIKIDAEIK